MHRSETDVGAVAEAGRRIMEEISRVVVGQAEAIRQILIAMLCEGHVLLEGVPGVAKTLMVKALAQAISTDFKRVQFTPDLMPSDVVGTSVFDPATGSFRLRKGPVFTGLLLADEINRTPPKTQAALLEAMEERRVTIDGETHSLDPVFTVVATQNPVEYEGTYPLPEAQLDRFMFKTIVPYPALETELGVLSRFNEGFRSIRLEEAGIQPAVDAKFLLELRRSVAAVTAEEPVLRYTAEIVRRTRQNPNLILGGSPRASIHLLLAAKAQAALSGRDFVIPDDVKSLARPVLRHRLILRPESEIEGVTAERVIDSVLAEVQAPSAAVQ